MGLCHTDAWAVSETNTMTAVSSARIVLGSSALILSGYSSVVWVVPHSASLYCGEHWEKMRLRGSTLHVLPLLLAVKHGHSKKTWALEKTWARPGAE